MIDSDKINREYQEIKCSRDYLQSSLTNFQHLPQWLNWS